MDELAMARAAEVPGHDPAPDIAMLESLGWEVFPAAREFLARYGGVTVHYLRGGRPYELIFGATGPRFGRLYAEHYREDEASIGMRLAPVGTDTFPGILIDEAGRFYTVFEPALVRYGDTVDELIANLMLYDQSQTGTLIRGG